VGCSLSSDLGRTSKSLGTTGLKAPHAAKTNRAYLGIGQTYLTEHRN